MTLQSAIDATLAFVQQRKRAYQLTFCNPIGNQVLTDLATFCRANDTCFHADPRLHAVAEGRREVWLRIQKHLRLSEEDLFALLSGRSLNPTE